MDKIKKIEKIEIKKKQNKKIVNIIKKKNRIKINIIKKQIKN